MAAVQIGREDNLWGRALLARPPVLVAERASTLTVLVKLSRAENGLGIGRLAHTANTVHRLLAFGRT